LASNRTLLHRAEPIGLDQPRRAHRKCFARADHNTLGLGLEPDDIERRRQPAELEAAPLANGIMDQPLVRAEYRPRLINNLADAFGLGAQRADDAGIIAIGTKQIS